MAIQRVFFLNKMTDKHWIFVKCRYLYKHGRGRIDVIFVIIILGYFQLCSLVAQVKRLP